MYDARFFNRFKQWFIRITLILSADKEHRFSLYALDRLDRGIYVRRLGIVDKVDSIHRTYLFETVTDPAETLKRRNDTRVSDPHDFSRRQSGKGVGGIMFTVERKLVPAHDPFTVIAEPIIFEIGSVYFFLQREPLHNRFRLIFKGANHRIVVIENAILAFRAVF